MYIVISENFGQHLNKGVISCYVAKETRNPYRNICKWTSGDKHRSGDGGPAVNARLSHPEGLAITSYGTLYFAKGPYLRAIAPDGIICTNIGHHTHKAIWNHLPCAAPYLWIKLTFNGLCGLPFSFGKELVHLRWSHSFTSTVIMTFFTVSIKLLDIFMMDEGSFKF